MSLTRTVACLAAALVGRTRGVAERARVSRFVVALAPVGMAGGARLGSRERRRIGGWPGSWRRLPRREVRQPAREGHDQGKEDEPRGFHGMNPSLWR